MALDELLDEHEQGEKVRTWLKENALGLVGGLVLGLALIGGGKWWTQRQHEARVALGAVGERAFRASELEAKLVGRAADDETARLFADGCVAAVEASIPGRYSLPYKRHAAVGLAYDAWNMLALSAPSEPAWT